MDESLEAEAIWPQNDAWPIGMQAGWLLVEGHQMQKVSLLCKRSAAYSGTCCAITEVAADGARPSPNPTCSRHYILCKRASEIILKRVFCGSKQACQYVAVIKQINK